MEEDYRPLFTVSFQHNYFADGTIPGLLIEPDPPTRKTLSSLHFIFRSITSGLIILYDTNFYTPGDFAIYAGKKLTFIVKMTDSDFINYTLLPIRDNAIFCFTNANYKVKDKVGSPVELTVKKFPGSDDLYQMEPSQFQIAVTNGAKTADIQLSDAFGKIVSPFSITRTTLTYRNTDGICLRNQQNKKTKLFVNSFVYKTKPFAVIELFLYEKTLNPSANVFEKGNSSEKNYNITFDSRTAKWRYYIVNKTNIKVDNLSIESTNNKIMFVNKGRITAIDKSSFLVTSKSALKLQQYADQKLDLILKNKKGSSVLTNIPMPCAETLKTENKMNFIDTYIYI